MVTVRCSKHIRETCIPGVIVTVKYEGLNEKNELHFNHFPPKFVRIRNDVSWSQLKYQFHKDGKKL